MNQETETSTTVTSQPVQPASIVRQRRPDHRWSKIAEQMTAGTIVTVKVLDVVSNKEGRVCGLNTKLDGLRAFLPASHVPRNESYDALKGTTIEVKVLECDPNDRGGKLVVSRTAALQGARTQAIEALILNAEVTGKVVSVVDGLGYFVNLGVIDALLHVTQTPLENGAPKVFSVGETLTARVSAVNKETGKVGLSMRAPRPEQSRNERTESRPAPRAARPMSVPAATRSAEPATLDKASAPKPAPLPRVKKPSKPSVSAQPAASKAKSTVTFTSFADLAAHFAPASAE